MQTVPIKLVNIGNGVEILGQNKLLRLPNLDYDQLVDMLTQPESEHHPFLEQIRSKLIEPPRTQHRKQPYLLGKRVVLLSDACPHCLAMHYPFSSTQVQAMPEVLTERTYEENKLVELDSFGMVSIQSLDVISHAGCCPTRKQVLGSEPMEEHAIDERVLRHDWMRQVVTNVSFVCTGVWTIEATLMNETRRYVGVTKQAALEKLAVDVLVSHYNYGGFALGLTEKTAYLNLLRMKFAEDCFAKPRQELSGVEAGWFTDFGLTGDVQAARAATWRDRFDVTCLELTVDGTTYLAIGESVEACVVEIVEQRDRGMSSRKQASVGAKEGAQVVRFEDAWSLKYHVMILGVEDHA